MENPSKTEITEIIKENFDLVLSSKNQLFMQDNKICLAGENLVRSAARGNKADCPLRTKALEQIHYCK